MAQVNLPPKIPLPEPLAVSIDGQIIGNYRIERTIGQGTYGKVKLAHHVHTNVKFAIKIIEKAQLLNSKQIARLQREIRFLKLLHHPHIVKVYDVIETSDTIYIAMEYEAGGELFDYIVAHKRVKEREARSFFRMVLSAVDYCHKNSVIHRDLKPENLLLDEHKCIKIIDFGFGNNFTVDGLLDTFCGSPFYAAPEMILGKRYEGPEVDMWSLGVILFALLCGHLPFDDDNIKELYKKIASGSFICPDYLMPSLLNALNIIIDARHLILRLIKVDPKQRATLDEVLASPWVNEGYNAPPPNYLPVRPVITDSSLLSKEIINRILAFGYQMEDVKKAFSPESDQSKPNPVRSTYFLLLEMLQREESRVQNEKRALQKKELAAKPKSISAYSLGKIEENSSTKSSEQLNSSRKAAESNGRHIGKHRPFASMQILTAQFSRRVSTPDSAVVKSPYSSLALPMQRPTASMHISGPMSAPVDGNIESQIPDVSQSASRLSLSPPVEYKDALRRGSLGKMKEELRAVSGWFLSVSTTTSKAPAEILKELTRVLDINSVSYKAENAFTMLCEVDVDTLLYDIYNNQSMDGQALRVKRGGLLSFQVEVCKVPKSVTGGGLYGLNFKRMSGGVWNYKKVCNKLLHQMNL